MLKKVTLLLAVASTAGLNADQKIESVTFKKEDGKSTVTIPVGKVIKPGQDGVPAVEEIVVTDKTGKPVTLKEVDEMPENHSLALSQDAGVLDSFKASFKKLGRKIKGLWVNASNVEKGAVVGIGAAAGLAATYLFGVVPAVKLKQSGKTFGDLGSSVVAGVKAPFVAVVDVTKSFGRFASDVKDKKDFNESFKARVLRGRREVKMDPASKQEFKALTDKDGKAPQFGSDDFKFKDEAEFREAVTNGDRRAVFRSSVLTDEQISKIKNEQSVTT